MAVSGTIAVIGAVGVNDDDVGTNAGSTYVFDLLSCGAACNETSKLTASDAAGDDEFGYSVSISGTTTVIGAIRGDETVTNSGSAYVFDCSSFPCTQISILKASDAADGDLFGRSVSVSGTTAVVGALGDDDGGTLSGSAYVFNLPTCGVSCTQTSKLTASDAAANDRLGYSVSISGTTALVASPFDDDAGSSSGSAYAFDLATCGAACTQSSKLTTSDAAGDDHLGYSVSVSSGRTVIGASDDDEGDYSGSAYIFELSNCGAACNENSKLTASDAAAFDQFGYSVSISDSITLIGAPYDDDGGESSGSAYVFKDIHTWLGAVYHLLFD